MASLKEMPEEQLPLFSGRKKRMFSSASPVRVCFFPSSPLSYHTKGEGARIGHPKESVYCNQEVCPYAVSDRPRPQPLY